MNFTEKLKRVLYPESSKVILWSILTTLFTVVPAAGHLLIRTFTSVQPIPAGLPLAIIEGSISGFNFMGSGSQASVLWANIVIDMIFWYLIALLIIEFYRRQK